MDQDTQQDLAASGMDGSPVLVHKEGCEGGLVIGSLSGRVLSPSEAPDWAGGLVVAILTERHEFYTSRLGPQFAETRMQDNPIDFRDLGWVGVDAEGEPVTLDADSEYRMDVIAEATGTTRTDDLSDAANIEDVAGQKAYVVTDESHEYKNASAGTHITSKTWDEKVAEAGKASEAATTRTGT